MRFNFINTTELDHHQKEAIRSIWNEEYPVSLVYQNLEEFEVYLSKLEDARHTIIQNNEDTVGWFCAFTRESARWFVMIIDGAYQGQGLGSKLLSECKKLHSELFGWIVHDAKYKKRNGSPYLSPGPFYLKNGFVILEEERLETDKLVATKISWKKDESV